MADSRGVARPVTVATADALDGEWAELLSARCGPISGGHGVVVGSVSIDVLWGSTVVRNGDEAAVAVADPSTLLGKLLRVTYLDEEEELQTLFLGRIQHARPNAASASTQLEVEGILGLLARVPVIACTEVLPLGTLSEWPTASIIPAFVAPPINGPRPNQADPTAMPIDTAPAYDRSGAGVVWTAASYSEYLLGRIARAPTQGTASGITWVFADAAAIDYDLPRIETQGKRILALLGELWPQSRAVSFRVSAIDYAAATVTIEAISIDGSASGNLNLDTGAVTARSIDLRREVPGVAVTGGAARSGITVYWDADDEDSSLVPDFTPGAAADAYLGDALDADAENLEPIWRRWKINPDWPGNTWNNAFDGLETITSANGARIFTGISGVPTLSVFAAQLGRGILADSAALPRPVAVAWDGSEGEDLTPYGILCDDATHTISIGSTIRDASELRDILDGRTLLISLAIAEPEPIAAWADASPWPQGQPELVHEAHPDLIRQRIAAGTVLGVETDTGGLLTQATELVERDDTPLLLELRDLLADRYTTTTGRASATWLDLLHDIQPGQTFGGVIARGTTYAFPLSVAEVTRDPQRQTTTARLVPIVAEDPRT